MDAPRANFGTVRRICVVKPSALGDIVQALPILPALRARFPLARIAWVANRSFAPLLRPVPLLDEVIEFDRGLLRTNPAAGAAGFARLLAGLRRRRFDLAIDLQGLFRSGLMLGATGARWRVGLRSAREGAGLFATHLVDDAAGPPDAVRRYWQVGRWLGADAEAPSEFPLGLTAAELAAADELLAGLPRPLLAVAPGAAWATKRWPAASFAAAANLLPAGVAAGVAVLGGPGEEAFAAEVSAGLALPNRNLAGRTPLRLLAAALARCDLLLANDSGPTHLAAAVGTPTVSIFTCTDPARAAPFGNGHRVVRTGVPCRGSYLKSCGHVSCFANITPELVAGVVARGKTS